MKMIDLQKLTFEVCRELCCTCLENKDERIHGYFYVELCGVKCQLLALILSIGSVEHMIGRAPKFKNIGHIMIAKVRKFEFPEETPGDQEAINYYLDKFGAEFYSPYMPRNVAM